MQAEIEAEIIGEPTEKSKAQAWADTASAKVKEAEANLVEATRLKGVAEAEKTEATQANETAQQGDNEQAKTDAAARLEKATADYNKAVEAETAAQQALETAKQVEQEAKAAIAA